MWYSDYRRNSTQGGRKDFQDMCKAFLRKLEAAPLRYYYESTE